MVGLQLVLTVALALASASGEETASEAEEDAASAETEEVEQAPGNDVPQTRFGASVGFSTAFVSGPINPGSNGEGATWNPRVNFALRMTGRMRLRPQGYLTASWTLRRDLRFDDRDDPQARSHNGGTTSSQVIDTGDLVLAYRDMDVVSPAKGLHVSAAGRVTLPASRESLVCNPMYAAVGADLGLWYQIGGMTLLSLDAGVDRVFHRHAAAPRGRCGVDLADYEGTDTLSGTVQPDDWNATFVQGALNPAWVTSGSLTMIGWHGLFGLIPGVAETKGFRQLRSSVSVGVRSIVRRSDPEATVRIATGEVVVPRAKTPPVTSFPVSAAVGWQIGRHLRTTVSLSNQLPRWTSDPSARLRLLPATTSLAVGVSGTW